MLKTRILPTLLYKDDGLVKGVSFASDRKVGSAMQAVKVYNRREVDELVFVDVTASVTGRAPDFQLVDDLADECFMPMTVGGGVSHVDHIHGLLSVGADKVCLNTACFDDLGLITSGAERFGRQCVVVAIDARREESDWRVFSHSGKRPTAYDPVEWARRVEAAGAGEILLTSIDRDGTMSGYDVELTRRVVDAVSIPVIASGGAGDYAHFADVLSAGGASAVAAASMYHFTERTPREAKEYLRGRGFPVRS